MPLHINLLAEKLETEELRRRDPVKRVTWAAALLVGTLGIWCGYAQMKVLKANGDLKRLKFQWEVKKPEFDAISVQTKEILALEAKLGALDRFRTNRFLWGNLMDALQEACDPDIELTRFTGRQAYLVTIPVINPNKSSTKPLEKAKSKEQIAVVLEAKDYSNPPGDRINYFRQNIASKPYFTSFLGNVGDRVRLIDRSPPRPDLAKLNRQVVVFSLELQYPEIVRE